MAYKISLVGASQAEENEFRSLVDKAGQKLRQRFELGSEADADLVVIDLDSVFGHMAWLKANGSGKRTAALTTRQEVHETDLILRRPLSADGVATMLTEFLDGSPERTFEPPETTPMPAAPAASAAPAAPAYERERERVREPERSRGMPPPPVLRPAAAPREMPPAAVAPPAPAPSPPPAAAPPRDAALADYLSGTPLDRASRLVSDGAPDLILDPTTQNYHAGGTGLRALAAHCQRTIKPDDWKPVSAMELEQARAAAPAQPYSRLLWYYAIAASNGGLLPGLDPNARYKLTKWPQIEREFAKHFRIATFMLKQLSTLGEIVDGSGATLPDVIDFINAYYAIGFIESDMAKAADTEAKGGVLSRLRNPFGR